MDSSDQQLSADEFCDAIETSEPTMSPIQGYVNMPLVSLEKAVEPLASILPEVKQMVWTVKQRCKDPVDNLSSDESASILLYTLSWPVTEKAFYYNLNRALRNPDRTALVPWLSYLKLVLTALAKISSEQRQLYRGVKEDFSARYVQGSTCVWWGFSSCTTTIHVLKSDLFLGEAGIRTLFILDCHSAKDIRRHSALEKENEMLLLPARQFKVSSSLKQGTDLSIIQLEEIEPLLEPLPVNGLLSQTFLKKRNGPYRNPGLEQSIRNGSSGSINLAGQQLKDEDMTIVTRQALIDRRCVMLDLTYNQVTQHGVCILADALRDNTHLEELNMSYNSVSDEGAKYLADMLATNVSLLRLSLSGNRIGSAGVNLLANALTQENTRLKILNLSANVDIDDESLASLIEMLKHNRSLQKLDLRYTHLSEEGIKRLQTEAKLKKGLTLWLLRCT